MQNELRNALETGFIDRTFASYTYYRPKLIVNDKKQKKKILSTLLYELEHCEGFVFSVAFLSKSGVAVLMNTLDELRNRGVKGEVLVSQYLNFTQPEALKALMQFDNIDLRIVTHGNFHAKGYFFKHRDHYAMIVGSSNLTAPALTTNKEWNLYVCAMDASKLIDESLKIFYEEFHKAQKVDETYIKHYERVYQYQGKMGMVAENATPYGMSDALMFKPNAMQEEAMQQLMALRQGQNGQIPQNKAMIISATGTGKTYLSVFDAQNYNPKRLLFVVHRSTIARSAMESYQKVFGATKTMGLFTGHHKNTEADFVFSTVQTLAKDEHLQAFDREAFEYIVIDESHHAGADTYQKILQYFKPKFLLGMTATPERTDGYNVFADFDHNIAYEVRLNHALDEEMLCPFHYYGVTDVCNEESATTSGESFLKLTAEERVTQIIEKSTFYGTDSGVIHGLVFCNKTEVAIELSHKFNQRGYRTLALTGKDSDEAREAAIKRLERIHGDEKLDYVFTVDIFNEGVDIPCVNQIIMLRPTQSAIVFVQQLGRGLRKADQKSYLTVIDFIGNYQNNYLIPVALYGDASFNKDRLRKLLAGGSVEIPGACTVNFDRVSKEQIFKAIDSANLSQKKDLDKDYDLLKFKLGRVPSMMDFIEHGSRDPMLYMLYAKSYYQYVLKREKEHLLLLDNRAQKHLECFGLYVANGKRYEELFLISCLLINGPMSVESLLEKAEACPYIKSFTRDKLHSAFINLNFKYMKEPFKKQWVSVGDKYEIAILEASGYTNHGMLHWDSDFKALMENAVFMSFFRDQLKCAMATFEEGYLPEQDFDGFVLYRKYARRDVFRILGWEENPLAQSVGGYMVQKDKKDCAIFVNYHKSEEISSTIKYEDGFVTPECFQWMSKSKRSLNSPDVIAIRQFEKHGMRLPLFIKKHNDEGHEFYYMGDVTPIPEDFEQSTMPDDHGNPVSVVKMMVQLKTPVMEEMYRYIVDTQANNSK